MPTSLPPQPLTIVEQRSGRDIRLHLIGDLDLEGAGQLQAHLTELQRTFRGRLILDLTRLEFLASPGMATLVAADAYARRDGWVLELTEPQPNVAKALEICGLLDQLPFTRR